jgi:hypothetical protein
MFKFLSNYRFMKAPRPDSYLRTVNRVVEEELITLPAAGARSPPPPHKKQRSKAVTLPSVP